MKQPFLIATILIVFFAGCAQENKMAASEIASVTEKTTQATAPEKTASTLTEKTVSTMSAAVSPTTAAAAEVPPGTFAAKTSDIKEEGYLFKYGGDEAILLRYQGQLFAYSRKCTHAGCPVNFKSNKLVCPCHGSEFNPLTGEVLKGPAKEALKKLEVIVDGDEVYVK